jgi:hypothetical protein
MRRVHINGLLSLMDYCDGSPDYASGGFIADSQFTGASVTNGSQQQWVTRNSDLDGWSNGVWNQVFCGDPGAPAQSFAPNAGDPGGPNPYTTLATCPVTEEEPFLYTDGQGNDRVFVPAVQQNSSGPAWTGGTEAGTSIPLSKFFVASPSTSVLAIDAALALGRDLILTPGVYDLDLPILVTGPRHGHPGPAARQRRHHRDPGHRGEAVRNDHRRGPRQLAGSAVGRHARIGQRHRPGPDPGRLLPHRRRRDHPRVGHGQPAGQRQQLDHR